MGHITGERIWNLLGTRSQGYLAHKKHPPPKDTTVALCLGTYDGPKGVGVSYERGTLVGMTLF